MTSAVNFVFCVHNHQPVDNFDRVLAQATRDCYDPFLEVAERHPGVRFCAHYSGPLLEWLEANRLDLFIRLRKLTDAGRLELLGGGFYEPIFPMLPERDAAGQIEMMRAYLRKNFGVEAPGLWTPERVWEPGLASTFAATGARYTVLDDFHFRAAGLADSELDGWFLTEDRGSLFRVFPLREELRYAIPYRDPQATVDYLLARATEAGERVVVYADDGEKFGVWPRTKEHVYGDGWLDRFFTALERHADRIRMITFSEALERTLARGRVYLPSVSYREMGEWSLLPGTRGEYEAARRQVAQAHLMPGGQWRNFRVKYPEANLMYGRMLAVSRRVAEAPEERRSKARPELYKAQCNCGWWHGVFGGLYLAHLRNSVYSHLIAAEREIDGDAPPGMQSLDLDLDGREDARLHNPHLNLFVLPAHGGALAEIDYRPKAVNYTATLARRPEPYHARVREATPGGHPVQSIHDMNVAKRGDLDRFLQYDAHPRLSLVDRFPGPDGQDQGDFATGAYRLEPVPDERLIAVKLSRAGRVAGTPVTVEKVIRLERDRAEFQVEYAIKASAPLWTRFAVEFNLAALSPTAPEAFLAGEDGRSIGALGEERRVDAPALFVHDGWRGLRLGFFATQGASFSVQPVHTVSQSESGFELSYQGTSLTPAWDAELEPGRPWSVVVTHRIEDR
jgi:alpha-amylase